ncbi:MAG TPA: hypothetical protein VHE60_10405 [Pyrinomonadaceae bacterium]|nr:hypothetical protein [Pyrinomonadaceae bacterium]
MSQKIINDRIDHVDRDTLNDTDLAILGEVDGSLADGLQLKAWWELTNSMNSYADKFPTALAFNRPDISFAFFDQAPLNGQMLPVLGDLQNLFYDRPKSPEPATSAAAEWMRDQVREFAFHYFMRISASRLPEAAVVPGTPSPPAFLNPLGLCPEREMDMEGFGFEQLYYKLRGTGLIGKFPPKQRLAIVDMREIGEKYEWIVINNRIFDFTINFAPAGDDLPWAEIPLRERELGVISGDLILNSDNPQPGLLGEYGMGIATLKNPDKSLVAYGPGYFDAGFETIRFSVLENGEVRARLVFVANRPQTYANVPINPAYWGFKLADTFSLGLTSRVFAPLDNALDQLRLPLSSVNVYTVDLINLLTAGQAGKQLCISNDEIQKYFLVKHFMQNYTWIVNSLLTWRQIPNWLDREALPDWVVRGEKRITVPNQGN